MKCEDCKFFSAIDVTTRDDIMRRRMRKFACTCNNEDSDNFFKSCPDVACKDFVKREPMNQLCLSSSTGEWIPICTFNPADLVTEAEEVCPNLDYYELTVNFSFTAKMTNLDYERLKALADAYVREKEGTDDE